MVGNYAQQFSMNEEKNGEVGHMGKGHTRWGQSGLRWLVWPGFASSSSSSHHKARAAAEAELPPLLPCRTSSTAPSAT
jgi:hypothetical protein